MAAEVGLAANLRPRLLDLFCGAGGAAMGYHRAGFEVVGVDIKPQPHYPFEFVQADVMELQWHHDRQLFRPPGTHVYLSEFAAIHASPPCQAFSITRRFTNRDHSDLLTPTRARLSAIGLPWIIENVPGAPMRPDLILCGTMFANLRVRRHRWFEGGNFQLPPFVPATCRCGIGETLTVTGHGMPSARGRWRKGSSTEWPAAMGIDWMNREELTQAIPPAYTEWIGRQLMTVLGF